MDFTTSSNNLFAALSTDQSQLRASLAQYSLSTAGTFLQAGKYPEAIGQLKKALSMDPSSTDAYNNLGNTYLAMNNTADAVVAYKNLIRLDPTSADAYNSLGNAYMQAGNNAEAEKQYKISAKMDPSSTYAPYALGNIYAQNNRLGEAEVQFTKVTKIAPKDAHGYYGLAMVDNKLGKYDDAVALATKALSLQKDFEEAHFELGNAYKGLGQNDKAQEQVDILTTLGNGTLAGDLKQALFAPKIISSLPDASSFKNLTGPGTLLKSLDAALFLPNTSKDFTMVFQFDTEMDSASIMNVGNWSIAKANGGEAGLYNNGVNLNSDTETSVARTPKRVVYDPSKMQATLTFTISQNAFATGTIDPSHLVFQFSGTDNFGNKIDPAADQVDGFKALSF
ncbi:MAG: tetratricopeptide repeat protein [Desulfuromonadaceae bacterium]|nr:tetratricopeptide repeat protein [Desulfuromonadaceae bacterium]